MTLAERNAVHVAAYRKCLAATYRSQSITPGRYWTNHEQAKAIEMRSRGVSYAVIGRKLGRSTNSVAARLRYVSMLSRCGHGTRIDDRPADVPPRAGPGRPKARPPEPPPTIFERQMQAVRNGARLVARIANPSRTYDFTLGGVSEIA